MPGGRIETGRDVVDDRRGLAREGPNGSHEAPGVAEQPYTKHAQDADGREDEQQERERWAGHAYDTSASETQEPLQVSVILEHEMELDEVVHGEWRLRYLGFLSYERQGVG